ncbi:hypothetical protein [Streptomyces iranensis]|uniref:Superfamily I DNA and RNA helicase-like protein n=1 Tax=Streptomyces iranensis TaxID=576784 RepID=A0A060ZJD6_9ACTN|nr:hypothetical protein [Streptomyces iranensis]MBP2068536.1 hypothetical protein [Streptomyces iranensis]CDR01255.1 Superfamily I DNA and RNA helicase-like protein [Streptomyces iranensis]
MASGLAHNRAREVFKEHLIGTVASTLERGTAEALAHIDTEITEAPASTSMPPPRPTCGLSASMARLPPTRPRCSMRTRFNVP